jgi:hypothetical protein
MSNIGIQTVPTRIDYYYLAQGTVTKIKLL